MSVARPETQTIDLGERLVARLVAASAAPGASCDRLAFPETLPPAAWCTAPELVGLWGTAIWERLDPVAQRRISFWEAVNFFSLNIHGERALITGLADRLYRTRTKSVTPYLHCFLDEENRHSQAFGTFCLRYAAKVYPPRTVMSASPATAERPEPGLDDLTFFARVLIFEEIADYHNRHMQHDDRLPPVVRAINAMHHRDESRHLQFGRRVVRQLWETHSGEWDDDAKEGLRRHLLEYLRAAWREYYNPLAYRDAGLTRTIDVVDDAWAHPTQVARRERASRSVLQYLEEVGVLNGIEMEGVNT